ncbi:hypothetical protein [Helicobacter sp. 11S02596-1]|uniref:RCC1 domain-containing protein n=1 Tax=Helicobacter sp. 11S02596-1 TaxID=1476194 RepID=UPI000BA60453|nr:hypothetical protein [Helicobacter sp. 11S02596-1]PAF41202.1 hypothetical protein BJI48_08965 [Helicobacter sp. 11S02596-1]
MPENQNPPETNPPTEPNNPPNDTPSNAPSTEALGTLKSIQADLTELKALKNDGLKEQTQILQAYADTLKGELGDQINAFQKNHLSAGVRLLKNVNPYRAIMVQKVLTDKTDGRIVYYGDILIQGGEDWKNGGGKASSTAYFTRVAFPKEAIMDQIIDIIGGHSNFYALLKDKNHIYVWGNNAHGCLGLGHTSAVPLPQRVAFPAVVKKIVSKTYASGYQFALVLLADGSVWGAGYNGNGTLGVGNTIARSSFTQLSTLNDPVKDIWSCSNYTGGCFALTQAGELYAWGWGGNGGLGLGNSADALRPTRIDGLKNVINVYPYSKDDSGFRQTNFVLVRNDDGDVLYGAGYNGHKQLNQDNTTDSSAFIKVFETTSRVKKFSGGTCYCICVLLEDNGNLWVWGHGNYGFGNNQATNNQNAMLIERGVSDFDHHPYNYQSVIFRKGDQLFAWGYNNNSLGIGNNTSQREYQLIPHLNFVDGEMDFMQTSIYEAERALLITDGKTLYANGTPYGGNLLVTSNAPMPQLIP